jgi:hypothetical protein
MTPYEYEALNEHAETHYQERNTMKTSIKIALFAAAYALFMVTVNYAVYSLAVWASYHGGFWMYFAVVFGVGMLLGVAAAAYQFGYKIPKLRKNF